MKQVYLNICGTLYFKLNGIDAINKITEVIRPKPNSDGHTVRTLEETCCPLRLAERVENSLSYICDVAM